MKIGNPLNALHIHLPLMEREFANGNTGPRTAPFPPPQTPRRATPPTRWMRILPIGREAWSSISACQVARSIASNYIVTIITHFSRPSRPATTQLKPASLNDVVDKPCIAGNQNCTIAGLTKGHTGRPNLSFGRPSDAAQLHSAGHLVKMPCKREQSGLLTCAPARAPSFWFSGPDTGGGHSAGQIHRIFFDLFLPPNRDGPGLDVVQRIVRSHGGRDCRARKPRRAGTTFRTGCPLLTPTRLRLEAPRGKKVIGTSFR